MASLVYYGVALLVIFLLERLLVIAWWRPRQFERHFKEQGVDGPSNWPLIGSMGELVHIYWKAKRAPLPSPPTPTNPRHQVLPLILPHLSIWREKYGRVFLYWCGLQPRLVVMKPELIKEWAMNPLKFSFPNDMKHPLLHKTFGESVVSVNGEDWVKKRRLLTPFFHTEHNKGLLGSILETVEEEMNRWRNLMVSNELEIDLRGEFERLMGYVIAKAVFGNDVDEGLRLVQMQSQLYTLLFQVMRFDFFFYRPASRLISLPFTLRGKSLRHKVDVQFNLLLKKRNASVVKQNDGWFASMLNSNTMLPSQILDECRSIVVAGSDTMSDMLSWACILLSIHTEWQDKAREEIQQVLEGRQPSYEDLRHLKTLNMIINETLRLYPSIPFIIKRVEEEMKLGGLIIPSGTMVEVPLIALHHDRGFWGENFDRFDPSRFSEGVSKATKHPMAFSPFMQGPRVCIGMNFALMVAKVVLVMILQKFAFIVSPKYKHEPISGFTLRPGKNSYVIFRKI